MEKVVPDTNILTEILKENGNIISFLDNLYISEVSKLELFYGALNKKEFISLEKFVNIFNITEFNEKISLKATELIFTYAKSHNLTIPDALVAAASICSKIPLFKLNLKDFRYIESIKLVNFW